MPPRKKTTKTTRPKSKSTKKFHKSNTKTETKTKSRKKKELAEQTTVVPYESKKSEPKERIQETKIVSSQESKESKETPYCMVLSQKRTKSQLLSFFKSFELKNAQEQKELQSMPLGELCSLAQSYELQMVENMLQTIRSQQSVLLSTEAKKASLALAQSLVVLLDLSVDTDVKNNVDSIWSLIQTYLEKMRTELKKKQGWWNWLQDHFTKLYSKILQFVKKHQNTLVGLVIFAGALYSLKYGMDSHYQSLDRKSEREFELEKLKLKNDAQFLRNEESKIQNTGYGFLNNVWGKTADFANQTVKEVGHVAKTVVRETGGVINTTTSNAVSGLGEVGNIALKVGVGAAAALSSLHLASQKSDSKYDSTTKQKESTFEELLKKKPDVKKFSQLIPGPVLKKSLTKTLKSGKSGSKKEKTGGAAHSRTEHTRIQTRSMTLQTLQAVHF